MPVGSGYAVPGSRPQPGPVVSPPAAPSIARGRRSSPDPDALLAECYARAHAAGRHAYRAPLACPSCQEASS